MDDSPALYSKQAATRSIAEMTGQRTRRQHSISHGRRAIAFLTRPQTALQRASHPRAAHFRANTLQQGVGQVTERRRPRRGDRAINARPIKFVVLVANHPRRSGVETKMQFYARWKGDRAAIIRWGLGGDRRHYGADHARRSASNGNHDNAGPDLAPAVFARFVLVSPKIDVRNDEARLGNRAARHISRPSVRRVRAVGGRAVCSVRRRDRQASPKHNPPSASSRGP